MRQGTFFCIDAHTCGNPVRLVTSGYPVLRGDTMSDKRQDFMQNYDWVRKALMFEPRGHDIMSGSIVYPPLSVEADAAILFIETSSCLPMCGHGTIGTVTAAIEYGIIKPRTPGKVVLDVPAGQIHLEYTQIDDKVKSVKIYNVASFLAHSEVLIDCPGLGELILDVAYGGNYYAIIDPQKNYLGLEHFTAHQILHFSPIIRRLLNETVECVHPHDSTVNGISHIMWTTDDTIHLESHARNAAFYGDNAIDRSPCGTGTCARMAQWLTKGKLKESDQFIHESIIGSQFIGRVEGLTSVDQYKAIVPSIEGWAKVTGHNTIFIDDDDPYMHGFVVK